MLELRTPRGLPVAVPETDAENTSPKFHAEELAEIAAYYREHGYVIVHGLVTPMRCKAIRDLWNREVKPSTSFIYRQATAKAERHSLNKQGWVMNPILNLQSVDPKEFRAFRDFAVKEILTSPRLIKVLSTVIGDRPTIVQSMYFEGNSATWEHQDTYYLDSEEIGSMAAAWIALEDIKARAGRFFVCDRSHAIDMGLHNRGNNIVDHHEAYISSVVETIREQKLEIKAPYLRQGDVLIWNSRTIHGSLDSQDQDHSRSSITLHAIPASRRFLQLQSRFIPLSGSDVNGVFVHRPKDLARTRARVIMLAESRFPRLFYAAKRIAVRGLITINSRG